MTANDLPSLPKLMVAPNGARRGKADHPAIPITLDEIVKDAAACFEAGADGLHLHLRDQAGRHILDAGMYREALVELRRVVPDMAVQITTEAMGQRGRQYEPGYQCAVALDSGAKLVSVSIREIAAGGDRDEKIARRAVMFYRACQERGIAVQHVLYNIHDFGLLEDVLPSTMFQAPELQLLFVLGQRWPTIDINSKPSMLTPYIYQMADHGLTSDWMACAFGPAETACLRLAASHGGKLRVGFENCLWHEDGTVAKSNAERIETIIREIDAPPAA